MTPVPEQGVKPHFRGPVEFLQGFDRLFILPNTHRRQNFHILDHAGKIFSRFNLSLNGLDISHKRQIPGEEG